MGTTQSNETYLSTPDQNGDRYWADFERNHFAAGVSRYAYRGTLHGSGPKSGDKCVVKVFKEAYAKRAGHWVIDMQTSETAEKYAREWNKKRNPSKPMTFTQPIIAKMDKRAAFNFLGLFPFYDESVTARIGAAEYVAFEPFIRGNYEKFNSNNGWRNRESLGAAAFSHFTWTESNCELVVCDIQGVREWDRYRLTDPAIHSTSRLYGATDHGQKGIDSFFSTHECNGLCEDLPIPSGISRNLLPPKRNTSYTFMMDS